MAPALSCRSHSISHRSCSRSLHLANVTVALRLLPGALPPDKTLTDRIGITQDATYAHRIPAKMKSLAGKRGLPVASRRLMPMPVNRNVLGIRAHRTPPQGRCYRRGGRTEPQLNLLRVVELLRPTSPRRCVMRSSAAYIRSEQQRAWTLDALVRFWTAVILRAPTALSRALADALDGASHCSGSRPEASSRRCPRPAAGVLRRGRSPIHGPAGGRRAAARRRWRRSAAGSPPWSSSTAPGWRIAHRLKLLWSDRAVILPVSAGRLY